MEENHQEMANNVRPSPIVICASGKMGSGKDFVSFNLLLPALEALLPGRRFMLLAFADHFKVDVVSKDKVSYDKVYGSERDQETRQKLQLRGTEEGRNKFGADIWIETVDAWIQVHYSRGIDVFIITDGRFVNEVLWAKGIKRGWVIRIISPTRTRTRVMREAKQDEKVAKALMQHASETSLDVMEAAHLAGKDGSHFDFIVYNDVGQEKQAAATVKEIAKRIASKIQSSADERSKPTKKKRKLSE